MALRRELVVIQVSLLCSDRQGHATTKSLVDCVNQLSETKGCFLYNITKCDININ